MQDKPNDIPATRPDGQALKPVPEMILQRRATAHFLPDPVPLKYLKAILQLAAQAPSGYDLQPWRFIVVRDQANRDRLQKAAKNQPKVGEAPVVIIVTGCPKETKARADEVFREAAERGAGKGKPVEEAEKEALNFIETTIGWEKWVNRHSMIAFTTMMMAAEAFGFDTAPMEGFDPKAVREAFEIPDDVEVIALLAIGKMKPPDKPYPGRLELNRIVFGEKFGQPWTGE